MRLLLDEHYSREIAGALRPLGHDVVAVAERPELAGLPDAQLLLLMTAERRGIVTENWAHFARLLRQAVEDGLEHYGVVFTSRTQLPRGRRTIGLFVRVLDELLRANPADDALLNGARWLP